MSHSAECIDTDFHRRGGSGEIRLAVDCSRVDCIRR